LFAESKFVSPGGEYGTQANDGASGGAAWRSLGTRRKGELTEHDR